MSETTLFLVIETAFLSIFHYFLGIGTCNLHEVTPIRIVATSIYIILILWGLSVGNTVTYNNRKAKDQLANPSLARNTPGLIFNAHFLICILHTLVLGPYFIINGLRKWYWTSFVAMLFGSIPIAQFNYNKESFGNAVGTFVVYRNIFELFFSLYLAVTLDDDDESFRRLSVYHFWIWGYRLLDVGPRRLMKSLLVPSSSMLVVLIILYLGAIAALSNDLVLFVGAPSCGDFSNLDESPLMMAVRILFSFALYFSFYLFQKGYVEKDIHKETGFDFRPAVPGGTHDELVKKNKKQD